MVSDPITANWKQQTYENSKTNHLNNKNSYLYSSAIHL